VPKSRYSRIFLVTTLAAALAAWCLWYKPWEAHYQGLPSSYWAGVLLAKDRETRANGSGRGAPDGYLAAIHLGLSSGFSGGQELAGREFEKVLEELLDHPDAEVRRVATVRLCEFGGGRSHLAPPVLIGCFLSNPDPVVRAEIVQIISSRASIDPNTVRPLIPKLLECHDTGSNQFTRNAIVQILRTLDPKSVWPPIEHQFSFDASSRSFRGFVGWQAEASERNGGVWSTVGDATAPSFCGFPLAQTGGCSDAYLHQFVSVHSSMKNIALHASVKAVSGTAEQGGGLLWRHSSSDSYYAAGISSLDGSLRLYKVVRGDCIQLAAKQGIQLAVGKWHDVSIKHIGDDIECSLNGTKYIEVADASIPDAGQIGLWTKTDAQTYFDGLRVTDYGPGVEAGSSLETGFRGISGQDH
jgi:hypothetical protein